MFRWPICLVALLWILHAVSPPAQSRPGRARATASQRRARVQARKHIRKGRRHLRKRRYQQAVWSYERALQLWKHRSILYRLALAHARLGQRVRAGTYLRRYHHAPGKKRRRLPRVLTDLQRSVGTLIIEVADPGAVIFVNGRRVGSGKVEVVVLPGKHLVEVRKDDWVAKRQALTITGGTDRRLVLATLPRRPPRPGPKPAPRKWPWGRLHWAYFTAAASVTVALLAGAIGMSVKNKSTYETFEQRPWDASLAARGRRQQVAANVLWGLTAVAAAAAATLGVFTRWSLSKEKTDRVSVRPGFWPGGASLGVTW